MRCDRVSALVIRIDPDIFASEDLPDLNWEYPDSWRDYAHQPFTWPDGAKGVEITFPEGTEITIEPAS